MALRIKRIVPGIALLIGLTAGNFMFQSWQDAPSYKTATERSIMQAFAVAAAIILLP